MELPFSLSPRYLTSEHGKRVRYRGDHLKRNFIGMIFNSRFEIILFDPVMAESVLLWGEKGIAVVFHWKGNNWIWIAEWNNRLAETFKQTVIKNKNKQTITFLKWKRKFWSRLWELNETNKCFKLVNIKYFMFSSMLLWSKHWSWYFQACRNSKEHRLENREIQRKTV